MISTLLENFQSFNRVCDAKRNEGKPKKKKNLRLMGIHFLVKTFHL